MGAMATITLPAASGADTRSLHSAAILQLRTVNGNTFNVAVRTSSAFALAASCAEVRLKTIIYDAFEK
jgi:hypothetical protein